MCNWPWIILYTKNSIWNKFYSILHNFFEFLKLFNNLVYEFMSVLSYCHQKEDQNSG